MDCQRIYDYIGASGVALVAVAALAVYLCAKYAVYLGWIGRIFHRHIAALGHGSARFDAEAEARSGNPLVRILAEAVRADCRGPDDLRAELAFQFHKNFRKVNRALTILRLISVISTLLGLLGTVLGISKVFRVIAGQAVANPAVLANGIWEALTTTIMGLAITIPVLCLYYFFRMQIHGFQVELMEYAGRFAAPQECGRG